MISFIRTAWINPANLELLGYAFFPNADAAQEFIETFYMTPLDPNGDSYMVPFPAQACPMHGTGTSFVANLVEVPDDGLVMMATLHDVGPVFADKNGDPDLWLEARNAVVRAKNTVSYVKAERFYQIDDEGEPVAPPTTVIEARSRFPNHRKDSIGETSATRPAEQPAITASAHKLTRE